MHLRVDLGGRRIIKKIFFKQKTAYEIVARDWSSDVCSSDLMRELGLEEEDFSVRLSDRGAWLDFCQDHEVAPSRVDEFFQIVDKIERDPEEKLRARLRAFEIELEVVRSFIEDGNASCSAAISVVMEELSARGLDRYVQVDLSIVRGLAYYTGVVFEVFDTRKSLRSVAGGGRYDSLVSIITDGSTDLPATGYAMGDCVIMELLKESPNALLKYQAWQQQQSSCDVYIVIADESKRPDALRLGHAVREAGLSADWPLSPLKVNKQFKAADQTLARFAFVVGSEFPEIKLRNLNSRTEESITPGTNPVEFLRGRMEEPDGPLIA